LRHKHAAYPASERESMLGYAHSSIASLDVKKSTPKSPKGPGPALDGALGWCHPGGKRGELAAGAHRAGPPLPAADGRCRPPASRRAATGRSRTGAAPAQRPPTRRRAVAPWAPVKLTLGSPPAPRPGSSQREIISQRRPKEKLATEPVVTRSTTKFGGMWESPP
jgi:hypothetical protein